MKRTKRYGGFLVGDRVRVKKPLKYRSEEGVVTDFMWGRVEVKLWYERKEEDEIITMWDSVLFSPNQLINLTRQEEEEQILHAKTQKIKSSQELFDELYNKYFPWTDKEKQKQIEVGEELLGLNKRSTFSFVYIKNPKTISQDDFMKDFKPTPFEDLITCSIKEGEEKLRKLAEQELCEMYGVEQPIVDNPALEEEATTEEKFMWLWRNKPDLRDILNTMSLSEPDFTMRIENLYNTFKIDIDKEAKEYSDTINKAQAEFADRVEEILSTNHPYPYNQDFSSTADY